MPRLGLKIQPNSGILVKFLKYKYFLSRLTKKDADMKLVPKTKYKYKICEDVKEIR